MKKITFRIVAFSFAVMTLATPSMSAIVTEPVTTTSTEPSEREINSAVKEFKSLSRKEKKSRFKEVKKLLKEYKADKKAAQEDDGETNTILLAILAILLPPLAIFLKERRLTWKFWLCIGLYVFTAVSLGFLSLPIILALLVVFNVL
jgi:uncharacterized membrane protein YqaE (UPF0057 family)